MKKFLLKSMTALFAASLFFAGCSSDSGSSDPVPTPTPSEEEETGTVSISVGVDGRYHCGACDEAYDTKEDAENCGETEACPAYKYTVTFTNSDESASDENKTKTVEVTKGNTLSGEDIPEWEKTVASGESGAYELVWESNPEGYTISSKINSNVTFTANWKKYYTVTFKDSEVSAEGYETIAAVDDVSQKVYDDAASKTVTAPAWEKTGYTLSWNPTFTESAEVTADATYTAVWTGKAKYTVTFVDSEATPTGNGGDSYATRTDSTNDSQTVFAGDTISTLPSWTTKTDDYDLTWNSSVDGLTPTSAITQSVTFTAVWTEHAKYTVTFVDSAIPSSVTGSTEIGAETDAENDSQIVYAGKKIATLPSWASASRTTKKDYTVTWTSNVEGLTPTSAITADVTFTASWTKTPKKYVMTFGGSGKNPTISVTPSGLVTATVSGSIDSNTSDSVTYAGTTTTTWLKIESSTSIVISGLTASSKATVSIVTNTDSGKIKINDTAYTASKKIVSNEVTADKDGKISITKSDSIDIAIIVVEVASN